jgi:hypothetical protein
MNNVISTSRYKWYTFLPIFLFQQFSRLANFYFLIVRRASGGVLALAAPPSPPITS